MFSEIRRADLRRSFGIKSQLIAVFTAVVLACIALFSLGIYFISLNEMKSSVRQALEYEYSYLSRQMAEASYDKQDASMLLSARSMDVSGFHIFKYAIYDSEGYLAAQSDGFPEHLIKNDLSGIQDRETTHRSASGWMEDESGTKFYVHLIPGEGATRHLTHVLFKTLIWAFPVGLVIAFFGGWFAAQSMLQRLKKLTHKASQMKLGHSNRLDISENHDELDGLSTEFNKLLDRIEADYQRVIKFTADASHELRLPITTIKGEAEIVLSRARDVEDYRRCLADILEEFERLSSLIHRLLQLARSDSGADTPDKSEIDLFSVAEKVTEFFEPAAELKSIDLKLIPSEPVIIHADISRLRELLSNIIDNALKYTPENGKVEVCIRRPEEGWAEILIKDNGIGIPAGEQQKIFERFHRVSEARERTGAGGDGLGLSIAKSIARAHGGDITVESIPRQGSCFTVRLPVA